MTLESSTNGICNRCSTQDFFKEYSAALAFVLHRYEENVLSTHAESEAMKYFCDRLVIAVLVLMTGLSPLSALAKDSTGVLDNAFTMILSAQNQNRYGGPIMLDSGTMTIEQIPDLLGSLEPGKVLPNRGEPIQVVVIVPRNAPDNYRNEFLKQISTSLRAHYPNAKFDLVESFVDLNEDARALLEQKVELQKLKQKATDSTDIKILDNAANEIDEGLKADQDLCNSWFGKACPRFYRYFNKSWKALKHPYNTVIAARAIAGTKAGFAIATTLSKVGINPASLAIATMQGAMTAVFGYNAKAWSEFCTSHTFPFLKDFYPVAWYNRNGWFKSASINFVLSLGLSYVFRMMSHLSGQQINGVPVETANSREFFLEGLSIVGPEIFLDGKVDDALRGLELKGRINDQGRKYLLWALSSVDTLMHTSFQAGDLRLAYIFAGMSWGGKLALWAAHSALKARAHRFIVLSGELEKRETGRQITAKNILSFVLGGGIGDAIYNRVTGNYTVSDRTMVEQNLALDELWNLNVSDVDLARIQNDPNLTDNELADMLNLKDSEPAILHRMMAYRAANLGKPITPRDLCEASLSQPRE